MHTALLMQDVEIAQRNENTHRCCAGHFRFSRSAANPALLAYRGKLDRIYFDATLSRASLPMMPPQEIAIEQFIKLLTSLASSSTVTVQAELGQGASVCMLGD